MSKTIKVIDLLNKIANGEELPKKIKYIGRKFILKFDDTNHIYFYETDTGFLLLKSIYNTNFLLDRVEIIEEQQDIDIQSIEEIKDIFIENSSCGEDVKYLARKYNEILKWAKQLDKKIKE